MPFLICTGGVFCHLESPLPSPFCLRLSARASIRIAAARILASVCQSQLKQLGTGLHNYHDVFGVYPPGLTGTTTGANHNSGRLSAFFGLLPYIDQTALFDKIVSGPGDNQGMNLDQSSLARYGSAHAELPVGCSP